MAARLGNVLYWMSCGIAALISVAVILWARRLEDIVIATVGAGLIWIVGRAFRYILSGR